MLSQAEKIKDELHEMLNDLLVDVVTQCWDVLALSTCEIQCRREAEGRYIVSVKKDDKYAGVFVVAKPTHE